MIILHSPAPPQSKLLAVSFCITLERLQYKTKPRRYLIIPVDSSFISKKIKLNNISIYKRQRVLCFLVFYKISLMIYCHLLLYLPIPQQARPQKNSEPVYIVFTCLHKKLNDQI